MGDDRSSAGLAGDEAAAKRKAAAYVGQVVGERYRVEALLALGGMGAVFRAEHVHMRKQVALKLLHPMTENLPELVTRFERESIVGSHVTHPNVCQATDFGRLEDGSHYLVLEYVEGRTLHALLKEGRLAPARAAEITAQIAAGLGAAHALDIVHRDVKPANVMICDGPEVVVKVVDFGLAKLPARRFHIDEKMSVTTAGTVFGTVAYMAPELARGMHHVDHRSDLYALGVMLYEMLAGKHPFDGVEPAAIFRAHCKQQPPPIAERAPGAVTPPALEAVVRRLLAKEPDARFQSAEELIAALDEACPPEEGAPVSPHQRPVPSARPSSRGRPAPSGHGRSSRSAAPAVPIEDPDDIAPPSDASPPPAPAASDTRPLPRPAGRGLQLAAVVAVVLGAVGAAWMFAPGFRAKLGIDAPPSAAPASPASPLPPVSAVAAPSSPSASASPPASSSAVAAALDPAATAAAASSVTAPPAPLSPEAVRLRGAMNEGAAAHDAKRSAVSLLALAKAAPEAFRDRDLVAETAAVAVTAALDPALADEVFALLTGPSLGESGADVLFHMTSFYGGSRGAARAAEPPGQARGPRPRITGAPRRPRSQGCRLQGSPGPLRSRRCRRRRARAQRAHRDARAHLRRRLRGLLRAPRPAAGGGRGQAPAAPAAVMRCLRR